jgi:hypothetical protein
MIALSVSAMPFFLATTEYPGSRGPIDSGGLNILSRQRLASDSIGAYALTLQNLVVGSAIQIETQAGTPVVNRTAASSTEVFSLAAYPSGNSANDLRIKVRKGSAAPFYIPWETLTTAIVGAQSIYVSQIPDE